jgi:dCMP deaminase
MQKNENTEKDNFWNITYLKIAELMAEKSTCYRVHVGAILVKDGRIISTGYNGVPSGMKHCNEIFKENNEIDNSLKEYFSSDSNFFTVWNSLLSHDGSTKSTLRYSPEDWSKLHHNFSEKFEVHAEQNCLLYAAKNGVSTKDTIVYVTTSPCDQCLKLLVAAGVKKVYYHKRYDRLSENYYNNLKFPIEVVQVDF